VSLPVLSRAACASMSTTTTTTRDRGDRYGPMEWAQQGTKSISTNVTEYKQDLNAGNNSISSMHPVHTGTATNVPACIAPTRTVTTRIQQHHNHQQQELATPRSIRTASFAIHHGRKC